MAKTAKKSNASKDNQQIVIQHINVGQLHRGNQSIKTWLNNVKAAERIINPRRKPLLDTYHDMDIDLHLESIEKKRVRAVKTVPWEWPLENDKIRDNFKSPWFTEFLEDGMSLIFKGHLVDQFTFQNGLIEDVELVPRQNVYPHPGVITKEMYGNTNGIEGETVWHFREEPNSNFMLEIGKPDDLGLYKKIFPYVYLKRSNMSDYARFNEMFGMPLRWYEYNPHDPTARDQVTKQAEAQGAAAYVVVPKGTTVNFHEANQSGASTTYKDFHKILNDEMTIGVLGQLLTTSSDGKGSYALGNVHKEVEEGINLEDRLMMEYLINYKLKNNILIPHGYPLEGINGAFQMSNELPKEKKADIWLKIEDRMPIADEDFYNEFDVPKPDAKAIKVWTERKKTLRPAQPGGADPAGKQ